MNIFLITAAVAFLISSFAKLFISKNDRKQSFIKRFCDSGGMPSAHSATVISLAAIVGLRIGFDSVAFAEATILALIVCYDAMKVRRSTGEIGEFVHKISDKFSGISRPYFARGHKPLEVFAGAVIGIIVAVVSNFYL